MKSLIPKFTTDRIPKGIFLLLFIGNVGLYSQSLNNSIGAVLALNSDPVTITVTEVLDLSMIAEVGASKQQDISIIGANLIEDIILTISGENANCFGVTPISVMPVSGIIVDTVIAVVYTPLARGNHTATLVISSQGVDDIILTLNGTATSVPVPLTPPNVIISEVYGGGGDLGALLKNDFIELYNSTGNDVNIGGWSIQYFSDTEAGTSTDVFEIPDGKSIPAKGHFLIEATAGRIGAVDLINPDISFLTLSLSGTSGKVILFNVNQAQVISNIESITINSTFKDYVPYGKTAMPIWESAMISNLSSTTSASRKRIGEYYSYTQNIGADFEIASPSPQNSQLTSLRRPKTGIDVVAENGSICFETNAGQLVEVFDVIGQKLVDFISIDGRNIVSLKERGMIIVKVGKVISKVILN